MPEITKTKVATIERMEKRDNPQIPWPDVQPFPKDVPKPTKNPDKIRKVVLATISDFISLKKIINNKGPIKTPKINIILQLIWSVSLWVIRFPIIPEMPIILPFTRKTIMAAMPIKIPPINEFKRVKFAQSIFSTLIFLEKS